MKFVSIMAVALSLSAAASVDYAGWVRPFAGTVGEGHTTPAACRPFGMVQPGPDTSNRHNCSGYVRSDEAIRGFSQMHFNGTGCAALGDVLIAPFTGDVADGDCASPWDRAGETAEPGYYRVRLERFGVLAEVTCTERVAVYRFTWERGGPARLMVDGDTFLYDSWRSGQGIDEAGGEAAGDGSKVTGWRRYRSWAPGEVHYVVSFSRPAVRVRRFAVEDKVTGGDERWNLDFDLPAGEPLEVRVALSTVSVAGAEANLAEAAGRKFDAIRADARAEWNGYLGRIDVDGDDAFKENFYTAMYHLFVQPNNIADVDGRYRGDDGAVRVAKGGRHYSTLSLWDTFRAAHPLYTVIAPERVEGFVETMLDFCDVHGHLPVWTLLGRESHCMIGMPAVPVLADAYLKGWRPRPAAELLAAMKRSLTEADRCWPFAGCEPYLKYGYIPCALAPGEADRPLPDNVSRTLELAYDWWCVARLARASGDGALAREAARRAECWRNVFDPETRFARGRLPDGSWRRPFDPFDNICYNRWQGDYTEANAWIYTWHVFQDPDALVAALGGRDAALARLDEFFSIPRRHSLGNYPQSVLDDVARGIARDGQFGQYWHGNEPSHHILYLYSLLGRPDRAGSFIRKVFAEAYSAAPDGLCGNDDCGQMSAWYVFSALGFYPFNPCDDGYVVGAPQTPRATVSLPGGRRLEVRAEGFGGVNLAVRRAAINGRAIRDARFSHRELLAGGELVFEMGR